MKAGTLSAFSLLLLSGISLGAQSIKEAVALALDHDPAVASASLALDASRAEAAAAFRDLLPSLNLGGSYTYISDPTQVSLSLGAKTLSLDLAQTNNFDVNAGVNWLAFSGFAQEASVQGKRLESLLAGNSLDAARIEVAIRTIAAYRGAQAAQLQIDSLESAKARTQLLIDKTQALAGEGMATSVEVLSLQQANLDYDQKLIAARAQLRNQVDRLSFLTGSAISVAAAPEADSGDSPPDMLPDSLSQLRALDLQREILDTRQTIAQSRFYPALDFSGSLHYGLPGSNPIQNAWMLYGSATAALSWSCDWGASLLKVQAVQSDKAKLDQDRLDASEELQLSYGEALRNLAASRQSLTVLTSALQLARTKMGIVKSQYEAGLATVSDYNDANLQLSQAEIQCKSQVIAILLQLSQLEGQSGRPIESWRLQQ